jgi:hypothetical protein
VRLSAKMIFIFLDVCKFSSVMVAADPISVFVFIRRDRPSRNSAESRPEILVLPAKHIGLEQ